MTLGKRLKICQHIRTPKIWQIFKCFAAQAPHDDIILSARLQKDQS